MVEKRLEQLSEENGLFSSFFSKQELKDSVGFLQEKAHKTPVEDPLYRRKHAYVKGIEQYWKERTRRKQVWELSGKLKQNEIAEKLGVSVRTVQRDVAKVRRYYRGQFNRFVRQLKEEKIQQVRAVLEGKTPIEQLKILSNLLAQQRKEEESRKRFMRTFFIIIDLDDMTNGFPSFRTFYASPYVNFKEGVQFVIRCIKNGQKHDLGGWTLKYAH